MVILCCYISFHATNIYIIKHQIIVISLYLCIKGIPPQNQATATDCLHPMQKSDADDVFFKRNSVCATTRQKGACSACH